MAAQPHRARLLFVLAVALSSVATAAPRPDNTTRYKAIRADIKRHLHFDFHCWCRAADPSTVVTVRAHVTDADIPVLISLLGDPAEQVVYGASGVLTKFGALPVPLLEEVARSKSGRASEAAEDALRWIRIRTPEPRPTP